MPWTLNNKQDLYDAQLQLNLSGSGIGIPVGSGIGVLVG